MAEKKRDYSARALYYLARSLVDQIGESEAYGRLHSVIGVSIIDFQLFREPGDETFGQWRFAMRADPQLNQPDQPPGCERSLLSATDDELNAWSDAVLVAKTLEEVFESLSAQYENIEASRGKLNP